MDYLGDIQVSKRGQQRPAVSAKIVPKKADKNGHWHATNEKVSINGPAFTKLMVLSQRHSSTLSNLGPVSGIFAYLSSLGPFALTWDL